VARCRDLAGDVPRLVAIRAGLRERMRQSPLCDATRFTRNLENAFREMWVKMLENAKAPAWAGALLGAKHN